MRDFFNWCYEHNLVNVGKDGTVAWKEQISEPSKPVTGGKNVDHKEKFKGARDGRQDLKDYEDHMSHMGVVWPFKVLPGGKGDMHADA